MLKPYASESTGDGSGDIPGDRLEVDESGDVTLVNVAAVAMTGCWLLRSKLPASEAC